jgi:hypothetical protein
LEHDWQHVLVTSTYRNESQETKTITPAPVWKGLEDEKRAGAILVADSIDSFDKRAYAAGPADGTDLPLEEVSLAPGEEKVYKVVMGVADAPLAAYGVVKALSGGSGAVRGSVKDPDGAPATRASLLVEVEGTLLPQYPNTDGGFSFRLPQGSYRLKAEDIGREVLEKEFRVERNGSTSVDLSVSKASLVRMEIRDESGGMSPAKVQFIGVEPTLTPYLGTDYRAHGGDHQYQTHDGRVEQQLPPGHYLLRITHGPEYDLVERQISVAAGETVEVNATLQRTVDTTGWISTDYHAHSTPSGDNYCNTNDRVINIAAEHVEFAPTTEHNRIYDWQPHIDRLGLSRRIRTVPGIELTGSGQHFNSFPLTPDPMSQNGGAPLWHYDPRINAVVLRNWGTPSLSTGGSRHDVGVNPRVGVQHFAGGPDRWVQANHPTVGTVFFDRDGNGELDGGFAGFEELIDGAEVWSAEILNLNPVYKGWNRRTGQNRTFGWLQMLNQGRRLWCVAVSDAHRIFGGGVGDWRTYVPSSTDEPGDIDPSEIIQNSKAGQMMITNGPFLKVETADGRPIGSTVISEGHIDLEVEVQTPNWIEIDRVQVLVNGRQPEQYNFRKDVNPRMFSDGVVKFEETIRVSLQQDAHLIVVATGENSTLELGWGRAEQARWRPVAYTNPIFVDVDRNGFEANGDTLGHPLVVTPGAD